ncbi:hypothetical protein BDB01DRAFT_831733 [Pilobolus umbonatus]|nr:hypothetical protein BDB01DRAFT_831733 [Pilobolus umbonatus]
MSFERVHMYLEAFYRSYNEIVVEETKRIDVVVISEHKLKMLLGKVGKIALINIRKELYKALNANTKEECHCKVQINFNLPCCHTLVSIDREYLYLKDIPSRWWLTDEDVTDNVERNDEALATQSLTYKPWMKYVRALEETSEMTEVLKKDSEDNNQPGLSNENEVKFPGRKKLIERKQLCLRITPIPIFIRKYKANIRAEKRKIERSENSIEDKKTININRKDIVVEDQVELNVEDNIYVQKKRRSIDTGIAPKFTLHPDINLNDVKDTFNPKANMMKSLGKNRDIYKGKLGLDVELAEAIITRGIDRTMSEIERADKNEKLPDVPLTHRNAMGAGIGHWFNTPDCSQILADAFSVPVCVYPDVAEEDSFSVTYLPIELPDRLSNKPRPIHFQNLGQVHWGAVKLSHSQTGLPPVHLPYINLKEQQKNYSYWNKWGQFPKLFEDSWGAPAGKMWCPPGNGSTCVAASARNSRYLLVDG